MPIIVDKAEKRRNIALACRDLLLENGIQNLTVSKIAQTAGVGKGTIYEYYTNKEDIVFEIITSFIEEYEQRLLAVKDSEMSTREKLSKFFFLFDEEVHAKKQLKAYQEFMSIALSDPTEQMINFSKNCNKRINSISTAIMQEAVDKGELKSQAVRIAHHLGIYHAGLLLEDKSSQINAREEINDLLNTLFILLETEK